MLQEQARTSLGARFEVDVERLDAALEAAIREGRPRGLRVLGYGEITLVVGWPSDDPVVAVKRLPPFPDVRRLDAYVDLLQRYMAILEERGVGVIETEIRSRPGPGRSVRGYLLQPFVPRTRHLNALLRTTAGERTTELLGQVVDNVCRCVDREVGLDAQAANWFLEDGRLVCFDVSTPMLRGSDGREELDLGLFLSIYPWIARQALARIAPGVMAQYHDPRTVLLDFASNLHKEGLDEHVPVLIRLANARVASPLSVGDVRRYFRQDKLLWALMQRLRLADRAWQRHMRRRPYPFLLPARYRYGPPRRQEGRTA